MHNIRPVILIANCDSQQHGVPVHVMTCSACHVACDVSRSPIQHGAWMNPEPPSACPCEHACVGASIESSLYRPGQPHGTRLSIVGQWGILTVYCNQHSIARTEGGRGSCSRAEETVRTHARARAHMCKHACTQTAMGWMGRVGRRDELREKALTIRADAAAQRQVCYGETSGMAMARGGGSLWQIGELKAKK